ncbi:snoRNA binding protein [Aureococcus anophagefferens]|nr:snoRNA binding protein [Aureococcus anophagefferens]
MSKGETLYVLHETASGYALFDVVELDEAFVGGDGAENINAVAEHSVPDRLRDFLEQYLPAISAKKKKKASFKLGVVEPDLGKAIAEATGCECRSDDVVRELIRGAKQHMASFVPELGGGTLEQSQLGLATRSRCKVKFNPRTT